MRFEDRKGMVLIWRKDEDHRGTFICVGADQNWSHAAVRFRAVYPQSALLLLIARKDKGEGHSLGLSRDEK